MILEKTITVDGVEIPVMECTPEQSWRMVHDGSECKCLTESTGITTTKFTLFTAATMAECVAEGKRLGLTNINECMANCTKEQLIASIRGAKDQVGILLKAIAESGIDVATIAASVSAQVELAKSQTGGGLAKP